MRCPFLFCIPHNSLFTFASICAILIERDWLLFCKKNDSPGRWCPLCIFKKGSEHMSEATFPTYKGRPLVRSGDTLYYGNMTDKYVIKLDIKSKKKVNDLEVADKVVVQLMLTDMSIRGRKQIVKQSEKPGLYLALDIADVWLNRALSE